MRSGELVLDLGAGHGALTAPLRAAGARVLAVELDRHAVGVLHERFDDDPGVTILGLDLADLRFPRRPFRVVANLPFATTSSILRRLLDPRAAMTRADVVLQRGAAVGWAREPRRRTTASQRAFDVRLGDTIRADRFVPRPSVDAAILVATRRR